MVNEEEVQEALAGHRDRNLAVLAELRDKGVSLEKPRLVDHHFWATTRRDAAALGKDLYSRGLLVVEMAPHTTEDGSQFWNVEAEIEQSPDQAASPDFAEELVRLAVEYDSIYDGWGTAV